MRSLITFLARPPGPFSLSTRGREADLRGDPDRFDWLRLRLRLRPWLRLRLPSRLRLRLRLLLRPLLRLRLRPLLRLPLRLLPPLPPLAAPPKPPFGSVRALARATLTTVPRRSNES